MKKSLVAIASVAAVCGVAHANLVYDNGVSTISPTIAGGGGAARAQTLTPGGIGHQLIIPYYNVQVGNATLFNLVNTDVVNGKAVKIRFRGASNSDDVFDFQLYMSPGDVWTATLIRGADGRTVLTTNDKSCTIPQVVSGASFVTARLDPRLSGDALAAQTREGYIEILNMADVPPLGINTAGAGAGGNGPGAAPFGAPLATANPLFTASKHVAGVAPCFSTTAGAAALNAMSFNPTNLSEFYGLGLRSPSTGLFANWTVINVPKSGAQSGEAVAIGLVDQGTQAPGRGNGVFFPQTATTAPTPDLWTADPALRTTTAGANGVQDGAGNPFAGTVPFIAASMFDFPDLSTPYYGFPASSATAPRFQAEALTKALAAVAVINEYITDSGITAATDWVFSMPTRRYSVALDYRPVAPAPYVRAFTRLTGRDYFNASNTSIVGNQICVSTAGVTYYDREETTAVGTSFVISPNPPVPAFQLCGEVSVLTFNAPGGQSVLGAEIARTDFSTGSIRDGWARIGTPGLNTGLGSFPAEFGVVNPPGGHGLPIVGKSFVRATNPAIAAGISGGFGASWEHRYTRPVP